VPKIWPITSSRSCNSAVSCPSGGSGVLPIRICHLITGLDTGGAERSLVNLVTAMNRDEFDNEVITLLKPGPMAQTLAQAGIPVTSMEIGRYRPNPAALLSLIRHLRAKKPAILQTWLYHADFVGSVVAFFAKPEHLIWNVRSSEIADPGIRLSTRYLARLLAMLSRWPDAIVVNSHDGQRYHGSIGYRPKTSRQCCERDWEFPPMP
jgi:Glycosyltransferase Family 4